MIINCHPYIRNFHKKRVTLSEQERRMMKKKRNDNRMKISNSPYLRPKGMWSQGSYAMHTMVQAKHNDFDIDDGIYFDKEDLRNGDGSLMSPGEVKKKIEDAVKADTVKAGASTTTIKDNCVRVVYGEGYHVDMPAYRIINNGQEYQLASKDEWKPSDPRAVTDWFNQAVANKSPESVGSYQMRRVVRLLKFFSKRQKDWVAEAPSGLIISVLVDECYSKQENRDDLALYYTMREIYDRLRQSLEVCHPIFKEEKLTKGSKDPKVLLFLQKLEKALDVLKILEHCTLEEALESWGEIFADKDFFCTGNDPDDGGNSNDNSITPKKPDPVKKKGGGRYA